jgi:hypothetical protein
MARNQHPLPDKNAVPFWMSNLINFKRIWLHGPWWNREFLSVELVPADNIKVIRTPEFLREYWIKMVNLTSMNYWGKLGTIKQIWPRAGKNKTTSSTEKMGEPHLPEASSCQELIHLNLHSQIWKAIIIVTLQNNPHGTHDYSRNSFMHMASTAEQEIKPYGIPTPAAS